MNKNEVTGLLGDAWTTLEEALKFKLVLFHMLLCIYLFFSKRWREHIFKIKSLNFSKIFIRNFAEQNLIRISNF